MHLYTFPFENWPCWQSHFSLFFGRQPEICNEITPDLENLSSTGYNFPVLLPPPGFLALATCSLSSCANNNFIWSSSNIKQLPNNLSSFLSQKHSWYIGIPRYQRLIWMQCGNILMCIRSGQNPVSDVEMYDSPMMQRRGLTFLVWRWR